jgi:hypothetical protein
MSEKCKRRERAGGSTFSRSRDLLYSAPGGQSRRKERTIPKAVLSDARSVIRHFKSYRLASFEAILEELLRHAGNLQAWRGKTVLELGPGHRVNLLRFFSEECGAAQVQGVGRAAAWPWRRGRAFMAKHVENAYLLDFLRAASDAAYDLIYSRHVMEHYSIDPWILLTSRRYWRQFRKNRFRNPGEDFPSSRTNVLSIFREAFRMLKPGGVIISQIAKRKNSWLDRAFLESLDPESIRERELGRLSCIITVTRKGAPEDSDRREARA